MFLGKPFHITIISKFKCWFRFIYKLNLNYNSFLFHFFHHNFYILLTPSMNRILKTNSCFLWRREHFKQHISYYFLEGHLNYWNMYYLKDDTTGWHSKVGSTLVELSQLRFSLSSLVFSFFLTIERFLFQLILENLSWGWWPNLSGGFSKTA